MRSFDGILTMNRNSVNKKQPFRSKKPNALGRWHLFCRTIAANIPSWSTVSASHHFMDIHREFCIIWKKGMNNDEFHRFANTRIHEALLWTLFQSMNAKSSISIDQSGLKERWKFLSYISLHFALVEECCWPWHRKKHCKTTSKKTGRLLWHCCQCKIRDQCHPPSRRRRPKSCFNISLRHWLIADRQHTPKLHVPFETWHKSSHPSCRGQRWKHRLFPVRAMDQQKRGSKQGTISKARQSI